MRNEIFRYIRPGDELVREPFQRLIEKRALLAYKYTGFWQCMDTFKDKQHLEELNQSHGAVEGLEPRGQSGIRMPLEAGVGRRMIQLNLKGAKPGPLQRSVPGLPIPTISKLAAAAQFCGWPNSIQDCIFHWVVFSAIGVREARRDAQPNCSAVPQR